MSEEEDTDPSANVPLWIQRAVERGLARHEKAQADREDRIIKALNGLGVARLELAQKATESGLHALRLDFEELRSRIEHVERFVRHPPTEPAPPPGE
jgi:hypothetical protein